MGIPLTPLTDAVELTEWIEPDGTVHALDLSAGVGLLVGRSGFGQTAHDVVLTPVPYLPGAVLQNVAPKERAIDLPLYITGSSQSQVRARWKEVVYWFDPVRGDGTLRYTGPDTSVLEIACRARGGLDVQEMMDGNASSVRHLQAIVSLVAPDAYWSEATAQSITYDTSSPRANFFDPPIHPLKLSSSTVLADGTVNNGGQTEAWPVWTITGPGFNPALRNLTTGKVFAINYTLGVGDVLVIDTRPRRLDQSIPAVLLNGSVNLYGTKLGPSELWPLVAGSNQVRIEMSNATADSSVVLEYTQRWLAA